MKANEILMQQLPDYFKPVLEYIELMKAYGFSLDKVEALSESLYNNMFIQTCDAETIKYWETLFKLSVRYGETLDYRRERLMQKFNQILPYTIGSFKARLTELFGEDYELSVDSKTCTMRIKVTSGRNGAIDLLYDLVLDMVPAHLKVVANQQVTNYAANTTYVGSFTMNSLIQTIFAEAT